MNIYLYFFNLLYYYLYEIYPHSLKANELILDYNNDYLYSNVFSNILLIIIKKNTNINNIFLSFFVINLLTSNFNYINYINFTQIGILTIYIHNSFYLFFYYYSIKYRYEYPNICVGSESRVNIEWF